MTKGEYYNFIVQVILAIVTALNLIFIIYVFTTGRWDRREDRIRGVEAFWFQEFLLRPNRDQIMNFFTQTEETLNQFLEVRSTSMATAKNQLLAQRFIRQFNETKSKLSSSSVAEISVINSSLSNELDIILDELQDFITAEYLRLCGANENHDSTITEIRRFKTRFLGVIYAKHVEKH